MNATMEKITDTIKANIEIEYETAVFSYLFDKGYSFCQSVTDKDIAKLEGNVMMTTEFVRNLVRCARELAKSFSLMDLMVYTRSELFMTPAVKVVTLWKDELPEEVNDYLIERLERDPDEEAERGDLTFKIICEEV